MNHKDESIYWYWLYNIEGIGIKTCKKLLEYYKTPESIFYNIKIEDILELHLHISKKAISNIINNRNMDIIRRNYQQLIEHGIECITACDLKYPQKLKDIYDPPGILYLKGKMPDIKKPSIAIVGARDCTNYGRELATFFAKELSKAGVQIISGLARGIDRYAHEGSIYEEGSSFAVLGCGIDICYPRENINLYMELVKHGGIISEYNLGCQPIKGNFPMRNRIISGFADGILLIEARKESGSLITMDLGLEQGKNIYACPGRIGDTLSYGTNHVIQQGGKLVMDPADILEELGMNIVVHDIQSKKNNNVLETQEKIVYDCISLMPKHMEEIMKEAGLGVNITAEILFKLQLNGCIKRTSGNYFARIMSKT